MPANNSEREIVLSREVPFAPDLVWRAIVETEHMQRWWGPDGFTIEDVVLDLRVGGTWTFVMVGPDGTRFPNHSVFTEITPTKRLAFDHGDGQREWFKSTIELIATGEGTRIKIGHLFPDKAARDDVVNNYGAIEGGQQHLAKLEAYVAASLI
ncbi:MAG: SRPBCC domain-containing protein [Planctomycetaceae bacterium]|nr:SRPBCC domain-containing protein [Planctomycetaceae bacterium]